MANPLPTLRGSVQQVLYPFTRTVSCLTKVTTFLNGTERRWSQRPPLMSFVLPMSSLLATDKAAWLSLMVLLKGQLTQDLTLNIGGTDYNNLTLMSDDLMVINKLPRQYDQSVTLRQVQNYPYTPPAAFGSYPTLSWGKVAQMPFTQTSRFQTSVNDNPFGSRFAHGWFGTGLTGFPTSYLRSWKISYPLLSDADLATLEIAFLSWQGRYSTFNFTDPLDGTLYHNVRMASDDLTVQYLTKNQNATELDLIQTFV